MEGEELLLYPFQRARPEACRPQAQGVKRKLPMQHFSCDLCGKELLPDVDRRYVVKIEVYAAHDPHELTDDDLSDDNLEALGELLQKIEDGGAEAAIPLA